MENEKEEVKKLVNAAVEKQPELTPLLGNPEFEKWFIENFPKAIEAVFKEHKKTFPNDFKNSIKHVQKYLERENKKKLKSYFDRLSNETKQLLEENYIPDTIERIINLIIAFEGVVVNSKRSKELFKLLKKTFNEANKTRGKVIDCCKFLLSNVSLTEPERIAIEAIKHRYEISLNNKKLIKLDPIKEMELSEILFRRPSLLMPFDKHEWLFGFIEAVNKFNFQKPRKRPTGIISTVLHRKIYSELTNEKPKKVKRHVEWAKKLTANIVNECINNLYGLSPLTAKDIDNSLHSKAVHV